MIKAKYAWKEVVGDKEKQGPVFLPYAVMRHSNLTPHATERRQGLLMRTDFIFIQIIQVVSQRTDEKVQSESVFYMATSQGQA